MAETKPKRKRKTKAEKLEEEMNQIEQEAKEYTEEHKPADTLEFPPIVLPCRGYFKKFDHGMYVENLQYAMNRIIEANIPVTGEYDAETMRAVEKFEEKYGGCVNGKFGETELIAYNKLRGVK